MNPAVTKEILTTGRYLYRRLLGTVLTFATYEVLKKQKFKYQEMRREEIHKKYKDMMSKKDGGWYND